MLITYVCNTQMNAYLDAKEIIFRWAISFLNFSEGWPPWKTIFWNFVMARKKTRILHEAHQAFFQETDETQQLSVIKYKHLPSSSSLSYSPWWDSRLGSKVREQR